MTRRAQKRDDRAPRPSGRHPDADQVVVRLTDAAMDDLHTMVRKGDPHVVRWALKKCLLLERDPEAGEELRGGLIGFRKLVVGDRDWRVIWRVTHDEVGPTVVDVAEVWAVGARSDAEVYHEMLRRVSSLKLAPHTRPLAEAIAALGRLTHGLEAAAEPADDSLPDWLVHVLTNVLGIPSDQVEALTGDQAQEIWQAYIAKPRS